MVAARALLGRAGGQDCLEVCGLPVKLKSRGCGASYIESRDIEWLVHDCIESNACL